MWWPETLYESHQLTSKRRKLYPFMNKSRLVETMPFWAEYHGGFKGFNPNEFFEWEDSHPLCSNALSPSGSVMITITITITIFYVIATMQTPILSELPLT
jgi:hypothetical protein